MAIVQISKIQNRRGLQQDLPQLDGGELGWSIDARKLYIGNGTLAEGAPVEGQTEILTEFSIIDFTAGFAGQINATEANVAVLQGNVITINNQINSLQQGNLGNIAFTIPSTPTTGTITTTNTSNGVISYTMTQGSAQRSGRISFSYNSATSAVSYDEEYTQTGTTVMSFNMTANSTQTNFNYNSAGAGTNSKLYYRLQSV